MANYHGRIAQNAKGPMAGVKLADRSRTSIDCLFEGSTLPGVGLSNKQLIPMANPQKESGHTDIANEVMDALCTAPLSGSEFRVLFFIIRKTWGWHKKLDQLSLTQIEKGTGLSRKGVCKVLASLEEQMLVRKVGGEYVNAYGFNKDYEQWGGVHPFIITTKGEEPGQTSEQSYTSEQTVTSEQLYTTPVNNRTPKLVNNRTPKLVNNRTHTKEKKESKENYTKAKGGYTPRQQEECSAFLKAFNETWKTNYTSTSPLLPNFVHWREHYSQEDILKAVKGSKRHDFWKEHSLSPTIMLRRKNPRGEEVDNIGDFRASYKEPPKIIEPPPRDPEPEVSEEQKASNLRRLDEMRRKFLGPRPQRDHEPNQEEFEESKRQALLASERLQANQTT